MLAIDLVGDVAGIFRLDLSEKRRGGKGRRSVARQKSPGGACPPCSSLTRTTSPAGPACRCPSTCRSFTPRLNVTGGSADDPGPWGLRDRKVWDLAASYRIGQSAVNRYVSIVGGIRADYAVTLTFVGTAPASSAASKNRRPVTPGTSLRSRLIAGPLACLTATFRPAS